MEKKMSVNSLPINEYSKLSDKAAFFGTGFSLSGLIKNQQTTQQQPQQLCSFYDVKNPLPELIEQE
jgi:hypothetical protein